MPRKKNTYGYDAKTLKHILNVLRRGTITWHMRGECLKKDRKRIVKGTFKNGNPKKKWLYRCQRCGEWFDLKEMEVDHIEEVGSFNGDFNEYVARMYCSIDNLQALCIGCHSKKTSAFNARERFVRK